MSKKTDDDYLRDWKGMQLIRGDCPSCDELRAVDQAMRVILLNPESYTWTQADLYLLSGGWEVGSSRPFYNFNSRSSSNKQQLSVALRYHFSMSLRRLS